MNKKVQELAKQCFRFDGYGEAIATYGNQEIEQFANLIIRECAEVAEQWYSDYPNDDRMLNEAVKDYFGVNK